MNEITLQWQTEGQRHTLILNGSRTIYIGRDRTSDIVLGARNVSRHHAFIVQQDGAFLLHNVSRTNPIHLQKEQQPIDLERNLHPTMLNSAQQVELTAGMLFRIGPNWFVVQSSANTNHVVACSGCGQWVDYAWQICKYCGTSLTGASTVLNFDAEVGE